FGFPQFGALGGGWAKNATEEPVKIMLYTDPNVAVGAAILSAVDFAAGIDDFKGVITSGAAVKNFFSGKKVTDALGALDDAWGVAKQLDGAVGTAGATREVAEAALNSAKNFEDKWPELPAGCLASLKGKPEIGLSMIAGFSDFFSPLGWAFKLSGSNVVIDLWQCQERDKKGICTKSRKLRYGGLRDKNSYWIDNEGLAKMGTTKRGGSDKQLRDQIIDVSKWDSGYGAVRVPWGTGVGS
ncbi:hypothetical protein ABZY03_34060, partial [Streptomyces klenkii]|uniref:hypothetical protein n=1 Tax=Streptomyces klenkii TaxID=1420899 RepID=UPI0033A279F9